MAKTSSTAKTASKKATSTKKEDLLGAPAKKVIKASKKEQENGHGFAQVRDVVPITSKNVKTQAAREMSLRDFVLGALVASPDMTNEEVYALVQKAGRDNAQSTTEWYAARVRQGHIKAVK